MASAEFIMKRIAGKQAEITKLEKKIARIEKAKASNWENNPYYYVEDDLKWASRDLQEAKAALARYGADLVTTQEKDASRNVKVILDFLDKWAEHVYEWYKEQFGVYLIERAEYAKEDQEHCDWFNHGGWNDPNKKEIEKKHREYQKRFHARWHFLEAYVTYRKEFDGEKLRRELEQDKKAKYDGIIERTNAICGKITDASGLYVGDKGDLNGRIVGERGVAVVQTIGAGGYNIQCFHFRTLVHEA